MVEAQWEPPLHTQLAAHKAAGSGGVCVSEWPQTGIIILRGHAHDAAFVSKTQEALGTSLPLAPRGTATHGDIRILWLSPDEWLILCPYAQKNALQDRLHNHLRGIFAQIVDNSGGYTALILHGEQRVRVLRHLTPFDIGNLQIGEVVGTVMSKSHVILTRPDADSHEIIVRRSFADYVWKLLKRAARPYGLSVLQK